jgi:hypothetical protein
VTAKFTESFPYRSLSDPAALKSNISYPLPPAFRRLALSQKKINPDTAESSNKPPITPPTIAPVGVEDELEELADVVAADAPVLLEVVTVCYVRIGCNRRNTS